VTFSTSQCATAEWSYRSLDGTDIGRFATAGYPNPNPCFTRHVAQLGTATPPLHPATPYALSVHVIASNGTTADWVTSFTTPKPLVSIVNPAVTPRSTSASVAFTTDVCASADFVYKSADGTDSGEWVGTGYPKGQPCFTDHHAELGVWTSPLHPKTAYSLLVTVVTPNGDQSTWTGTFTTS
jgi:hypothetical protein